MSMYIIFDFDELLADVVDHVPAVQFAAELDATHEGWTINDVCDTYSAVFEKRKD